MTAVVETSDLSAPERKPAPKPVPVLAAALEGVRLVVRRPVSWLAWSVICVVAITGFGWSVAATEKDIHLEGTVVACELPLFFVLAVLLGSAALRSVLTPERAQFAGLRLGVDELRQVVAGFGILIVLVLAVMIGASLVHIALGLLAVANNHDPVNALGLGLVLSAVVVIPTLGVRLSLIGPAMLARRRFAFAGPWKLAGRRYWSLAGAWTAVFGLLLVMFVTQVGLVKAIIGYPGAATAAGRMAVFAAKIGLYVLCFGPLVSLELAIVAGVAAGAWRALADRPETAAETFS